MKPLKAAFVLSTVMALVVLGQGTESPSPSPINGSSSPSPSPDGKGSLSSTPPPNGSLSSLPPPSNGSLSSLPPPSNGSLSSLPPPSNGSSSTPPTRGSLSSPPPTYHGSLSPPPPPPAPQPSPSLLMSSRSSPFLPTPSGSTHPQPAGTSHSPLPPSVSAHPPPQPSGTSHSPPPPPSVSAHPPPQPAGTSHSPPPPPTVSAHPPMKPSGTSHSPPPPSVSAHPPPPPSVSAHPPPKPSGTSHPPPMPPSSSSAATPRRSSAAPPQPPPSSSTQPPTPTTTTSSTGSSVMDGNWASWGNWSCSVRCGDGTRERTRTCTNPPPSAGGAACPGDGKQTGEPCNDGPCAKMIVNVEITITSMTWNANLADNSSVEYQEVIANIEAWGNDTFGGITGYTGIEVNQLTAGSVIADFDVLFEASDSGSSSDPPNYQQVITRAVSGGEISNLTVNAASLKTTERVEGVTLGVWVTDRLLCAKRCCDSTPSMVYQNRTCKPIQSPCWGVVVVKKIGCVEGGCTKGDCDSGVTAQISAIAMTLCLLASLRLFQ